MTTKGKLREEKKLNKNKTKNTKDLSRVNTFHLLLQDWVVSYELFFMGIFQ